MSERNYYRGCALRIAVGITMLVLLMAGGAGAATPISSCGTISSPGEYILNQDIVNFSDGTCIAITSNDVVFNGANYVIDGVTKNYTYGVYVNNKLTTINNVTLKNLKVKDWNYGIYYLNAQKGNITNSIVSLNGNESYSIVINGTRTFPSKGIHLDNSNYISITDNIIKSNNQSGISLSQSSNNSILRNDIDSNSFSGVMLNINSSNNKIENNRVSNHSFIGIILTGSSNNIIKNNTVENNDVGVELGIWVINRSAGIEVYSTNNTLINNTVNLNNQSGIKLGNFCNNNTLTNNTVDLNNQIGIFITQSSFNTVQHNKVSNNQYGIKLSSNSSNNTIYNNYFNNINNTDLKKNFDNRWNISRKPGINIIGGSYLGGNFWAYPNGTGFSQTCTDIDIDGICDSAYVLDNNNTDYFPLANRSTPAANVIISDSSFKPQTINVTAGTTVTWTNFDPIAHTVTSDTGLFDSGSLSPGQVFSRIFNIIGIYNYHCSIHPSMTGKVIVISGNPPAANVSISDSSFHPQTINVTAGTTVTWTNFDPIAHTVTSDTGLFDSGSLSPGQIFSRIFNTAGIFDYHCSIHPSMTGSVIVNSANPPPTSISNPQASMGTTWINWSWNNPLDTDFSHVMLYLNGSFKTNITVPQNYYNFTGLQPDTLYELGTHTVDTSGNVNETWVNATARTLPSGSVPPVADCGADKLRCENVASPVQFNASASYDPDGAIISYNWDFGDGTNATGVAPVHKYSTYRWNGTAYQPFNVNLTVTDNSGMTNSTSIKVVIWIPGDANGDGKVNILDASIVGLKWGTSDPCGDLNNDVKVNILDASIIGINWGKNAIKN